MTAEIIWTLKLPLDPNDYALRQLRSRFEAGRIVYNATLAEARRRGELFKDHPAKKAADETYKESGPMAAVIKALVDKAKKTKAEKQELRELKARAKELQDFQQEQYNTARKETSYYLNSAAANHGLNDSIGQWAAKLQKSWLGEHLDSSIIYAMADRAFGAVNKMVKGTGRTNKFGGKEKAKKVRFISYKPDKHSLACLDSGSNRKGIRYRDGELLWNIRGGKKLTIPVKFNERDLMVQHFFAFYRPFITRVAAKNNRFGDTDDPIREIAIVRKWVRGRWRYYVHLCVKAPPLIKPNHILGKGRIGLNVYSDRIGFFTEDQGGVITFESLHQYQPKVRRGQRRTARQQRIHNRVNFEPDFIGNDGFWRQGKVKSRPHLTLPWKVSTIQHGVYGLVAELQRCRASNRRDKHGEICNILRKYGDEIVVYQRHIRSWQQTPGLSKKVTNFAPATFLTLLKQKFAATGGDIHEVEGELTFWDNWPECLTEFAKEVSTAFSAYCVEIADDGTQKMDMRRLKKLAESHDYRTVLKGYTHISM